MAVAIVRTPSGTVGSLTYDNDPSGGGHLGEVVYPKRCPEPIHLWINASGHINCFRQETSYPKMLCRRTLGRTKGQPRSNGHEMGLCSSAFHLAARVTDWRLSLGALGAGSHRSGCGVLEEQYRPGFAFELDGVGQVFLPGVPLACTANHAER